MTDATPSLFVLSKLADTQVRRLLVMVHGYTGDENSMWIFSRAVSSPTHLIAPRALYPLQNGGYSWVKAKDTYETSHVEDFIHPADVLMKNIDHWIITNTPQVNEIDLMGFSQGAALSYIMGLKFPHRFRKIACLSGYFPEDRESLFSKPVRTETRYFIAHGKNDNIVPARMSREAFDILQRQDILVEYAEDDSGHKLGVENFQALKKFFDGPIYLEPE